MMRDHIEPPRPSPVNFDRMPQIGRLSSVRATLIELARRRPRSAIIVETGTTRSYTGRTGDGWATLAWCWYARETDGNVWTVDIDELCLDACRTILRGFERELRFVADDSIRFLDRFDTASFGAIDLLYLDSLDYSSPETSEQHALSEVRAAFGKLANDGLILIDDTVRRPEAPETAAVGWYGKGARAIPFALDRGFQVLFAADRQVLLHRPRHVASNETATNPRQIERPLHTAEVVPESPNRPSEESRMRFILSSHAPWFASSFGAQTRVLAPRLVQHGLAAIHCTHGLGGGSIDWNGIRCLPGVRRPHSEPVTGEHARREASGTVVALTDGREIDPRGCGPGIGFFAWTPVIGDSFHPTAAERLKRSDGVFGASAHAVRAAEKIGIEARLVPIAIDRRTMQPGDRGRAREKIGIPSDRFVLGVIAPSERIVSRRTIVAVMHAFSEFRKRRRDALLFVHADVGRTNGEGGVDLLELGASLGILDALALAPFDHVDFGIQPEEWAAIYNVLDVLVSPNITDDLGQVLLEAQACGCPAVVGDWGAMSEYHLLGEKIESEDADAVWLDAGTIARMPRVDALVAAMERAYRSGPPSDASRQSAHDRSAPFDVATVIRDHWRAALVRVAAQNEGLRN